MLLITLISLNNPSDDRMPHDIAKLEGVEGIEMVRFGVGDVVRHPVVGRIVQAYEGDQ